MSVSTDAFDDANDPALVASEAFNAASATAARYQAVVVALTSALDARDEYTGRHSTETSELAVRVGERLGMSAADREVLAQIAVLHDVGKLGIPTEVLLKQGPLDGPERAMMREHPVIGERILSGIAGPRCRYPVRPPRRPGLARDPRRSRPAAGVLAERAA